MGVLSVNKARSYYKTNPEVLTTFDSSMLIPLKCLKVIPNSSYRISAGTICRLPALKVPVMGKLYLEFFAFYVPYDLLDKKFEKLITEGHDNSFDDDLYGPGSHTPNTESVGKSITPDLFTPKLVGDGKEGFEVFSGDLFNRLGLPIANNEAHNRSVKYNADLLKSLQDKYKNVDSGSVLISKEYALKKKREVPSHVPYGKFSAYPCRAYYSIFNTHFRAKFLQDPLVTDHGIPESNPGAYTLQRVNRMADWFSRGFVSSQLNPVQVPLGVDVLPVDFGSDENPFYAPVGVKSDTIQALPFLPGELYRASDQSGEAIVEKYSDGADFDRHLTHYFTGNGNHFQTQFDSGVHYDKVANLTGMRGASVSLKSAIALGLDDLRYVIGLSHISQKALYGTDMDTILKMNFNLVMPKTCLKEPLMFGYKRVPIEINQITQTAPGEESNIGDVYGQSTTINRVDDGSFTFRSYNYGMIMLCCCVRHESVYQYGVDPIFTENDKFDLFQPDLQGLSNVGVPKLYIYFSGDETTDNSTFNFNEPYSELKHDHNVVNGEFASDSNTPLDFYHLADIYNDAPSYDDKWIKDTTKEVLDRALTITSENANQVQAYFKFTYERTLPMSDYFIGYDYI